MQFQMYQLMSLGIVYLHHDNRYLCPQPSFHLYHDTIKQASSSIASDSPEATNTALVICEGSAFIQIIFVYQSNVGMWNNFQFHLSTKHNLLGVQTFSCLLCEENVEQKYVSSEHCSTSVYISEMRTL